MVRRFRISDKPGWTHTSDAVAPVEVAVHLRTEPELGRFL
jgi:hypothetical protein